MNNHLPDQPLERKHETLVYIFNMSEDIWPFISAMSDPERRAAEILENVYLADLRLFLFAGENARVLFLCPHGISQQFLSYFQGLFGPKKITVLTPAQHSGVICEDILHDKSIMAQLVDAANSSRRLTVTSYAVTPQFLELVRHLRNKGLTVFIPEAPEEDDAWTVNFYGSKSGIRQLAQQSLDAEPDFRMADGLICFGMDDAAKIAATRYVKEGGVVVKTNKGHSGMGLMIFRPGDLPSTYHECVQAIHALLAKEAYWSKFPIVIEDLININPTLGGGCPNVEFKILKTGKVEFLYYCAMRMTRDGVFMGVEINNDVVSDRVAAQMVDTGFFVGERFAAAGYRGYYDVDFVAGKNGQLFVTESNVRSTGGTFVYATALELFGRDFMYATYLLSNNNYDVAHLGRPTLADMHARLSPILFARGKEEGLIITSENLLKMQRLAYIIFSKNRKRAYEIEEEMRELLQQEVRP